MLLMAYQYVLKEMQFVKWYQKDFRTIKAIACVTKDCGLPCGMCRQFINEFSPDCIVISGTISGELKGIYRLPEILAYAFGPKNLE
eukprot:gnl/Chilomastix_caulleri/5802.p1 GENE.gnl/Chilomastix_caulleri/5802~~gnl/Chilomastix_caulleri/5802.p1  ORF type:complete len:86 (+),score=9.86 gnl/Chilomastix_caulleri/5802:108-365(+)